MYPYQRLNLARPVIGVIAHRHRTTEESMPYQIDRSLFVENGPSLRAAAAIARVRTAALYAALNARRTEPAEEPRKAA